MFDYSSIFNSHTVHDTVVYNSASQVVAGEGKTLLFASGHGPPTWTVVRVMDVLACLTDRVVPLTVYQ